MWPALASVIEFSKWSPFQTLRDLFYVAEPFSGVLRREY